jgi:5-methyltetrahydrofolate--homocysteine methyltransferase
MSARAFTKAASRRRLLLDGAMATFIHDTSAARGPAHGCDVLSVHQPDRVRRVHDAYLDAGADIVRTNSFRLTSREHAADAAALGAAAARLARDAADTCSQRTPDRPRFVAAALGPPDDRDTHEQRRGAYRTPLRALLDGGVDLVLFETCWSPAQVAAALAAFSDAAGETGRDVPVVVSMALDPSGRLAVSGASVDDLLAAVDPALVVALGINCGAGVDGLSDPLTALRRRAGLVTCHPSAGLPDASGRYPIAPDAFAAALARYAAAGLVDVMGGCCGTTPAHVAALAHAGTQLVHRESDWNT